MRAAAAFALRFLARVALATWFGGFTVYAAVVVPDLHENLGGMETGEISRRVAPVLYEIGAAAVVLAWLVALTDRVQRSGWRGKARLGLLAVNSLLLIALIAMHRSLGIHLDSGRSLSAFRSSHEVYLSTWTAQWLAILGLMAIDAFPQMPEKGEYSAVDIAECKSVGRSIPSESVELVMSEPRASLLRRLSGPRLSLRLTMAVVLLVAVGLGWVITGARRQAETVEMVRRLGGEVQYDWQYRDFTDSGLTQPPGPKWLVDFVGPDYFFDVTLIQFNSWPTRLDEAFVVRFGELGQLQELRLGHAPAIGDAGFARLSGLTRMRRIDLSATGVSGRAFADLKGMTDLDTLFATEVPTLDSDLANLSGLTKLTSLGFQGDHLTDAGLAHLRPLRKLRSLQITSNGPMQITSAGLAHLSEMNDLFQLVLLSPSKVKSLEPIRGLTSLKNLGLIGACLDDESLAPLANLTNLEGLGLSGKDEKFGDDGLTYLAGLKSLDSLFLRDAKVGDAGLTYLAGLKKLESLNLDGTRVTDGGLAQLARLPKLKTLSLCRTAITDDGLTRLAGLAACKEISLKETKTTPAGIAALKARLPGVQIVQ